MLEFCGPQNIAVYPERDRGARTRRTHRRWSASVKRLCGVEAGTTRRLNCLPRVFRHTMVLPAGDYLRFYTKEESESWLSDRQRRKPDLMPDLQVERIRYLHEHYQVFFLAHAVAYGLTHRKPTLLFITEWEFGRAVRTGICTTSCARRAATIASSMKRRVTCSWNTKQRLWHRSCNYPC